MLPVTNKLIKDGLGPLGEAPEIFRRSAPGTYGLTAEELKERNLPLPPGQAEAGPLWVPIIPLCTDALRTPIPEVPRAKLKHKDLELIVTLILSRFKEVMGSALAMIKKWPLRVFLSVGQPIIRWLARKPLMEALIAQLGEDYEP